MLTTIQQTIERWNMARGVHRALLAVSGGADSMALLWALHRLWTPAGIELAVLHVDHGIRGADSQEDAGFVAAFCRRLDILCRCRTLDVPHAARQHGESLEMAARRLRRILFRETTATLQADVLCTGHTADDQIETLFLRLARGTGPRGLGGMPAIRLNQDAPPTLRPLLDCRRLELRAWLRKEGIPWREDASNEDLSILRNRVRHRVVPAFESALGPHAIPAALRTAELLQDEECHGWGPWVEQALRQCRVAQDSPALKASALRRQARPLVRRVLLAWLQEQSFPAENQSRALLERMVDFITALPEGTRHLSLGGHCVLTKQYDTLWLGDPAKRPHDVLPPRPPLPLNLPGTTRSDAWGLDVSTRIRHGIIAEPRHAPLRFPHAASLAWDVVQGAMLTLRAPRPGDRMQPSGMTGHRKIADILVDLKIPRDLRTRIPLVVCDHRIAWLPGVAVDAAFIVRNASEPAVHLEITEIPKRSAPGPSSCEA